MLYFPRQHETAEEIAFQWLDRPDQSYADKIRQMNQGSLGGSLFREMDGFAADFPVWMPTSELDQQDPLLAQLALSRFETLLPGQRHEIIQLARSGVDLNALAYAADMAHIASVAFKPEAEGVAEAEVEESHWYNKLETSADWFKGGFHLRHHRLDHFIESIEKLEVKLKHVLSAKAVNDAEDIYHHLRGSLKREYKAVQTQFAKEISRFKLERNIIYRKFWKMETLAQKEGIAILHTSEVEHAVRMARKLKLSIKSLGYVQYVVGGWEVYDSYHHHKAWEKKALEVGVDILEGVGIGALATMVFTGGGWAVALVGGTVDVVATSIANYISNQRIDKLC